MWVQTLVKSLAQRVAALENNSRKITETWCKLMFGACDKAPFHQQQDRKHHRKYYLYKRNHVPMHQEEEVGFFCSVNHILSCFCRFHLASYQLWNFWEEKLSTWKSVLIMHTGIGPSTQCIWINSPQSPSSYLKSNNEDFLRESATQSWLKKGN